MSNVKYKYIELATRKVISSYGGVGSLYETTKGSVKIESFDQWEFVHFGIEKYIKERDHDKLNLFTVYDNRLLSRLKYQFQKLERLICVPNNESNSHFSSEPKDKTNVIRAKYFPEWFYCNKCGSLKHINDWYKNWQKALVNISFDDVAGSFQEPKCAHCYLRFKNEYKQRSSKLYFNSMLCLEQVRFIMTAPNGNIRDLPWEQWNTAIKGKKNEDGGKITLDFENKCCDKQELKYIKSDTFEDYTGIRVKCSSCKKENTLSGLFGLKLRIKQGEDIFYKPVLRSSNSVYYPIIFNSIFIPIVEDDEVSQKIRDTVVTLSELSKTPEEIAEIISLDVQIVNKLLGLDNEVAVETENEYRLREYYYILSDKSKNSDNYIAHREEVNMLSALGIKSVIQIRRLKMTSVQTGYTRQEPYDKDLFLKENSSAKVKYTSRWGNEAQFLPAIESYGEGIFIELDSSAIKEWYNTHKGVIDARISRLRDDPKIIEGFMIKEKLSNYHLAKLLLIHTFSHIIIKELEFLCGYPATSICERLYNDDNNMQGILIYTIAGAEGSYGGLVSQGTDEKFEKLLRSALFRACDCASDPVCYNSEPQGVGGQNLAACYSCALLPENSCERFNSRLDRAILIDPEFGFFRINQ